MLQRHYLQEQGLVVVLTADPHTYIPAEVLEAAQWEDTTRQELIEEQRMRHLKENSAPPTLHAFRKDRFVAGKEENAPAPYIPQSPVRVGGRPWDSSRPLGGAVEPFEPVYAQDADSDDDGGWEAVRQRFGGNRQGTVEIRQGDGDTLVVKPVSAPPAAPLPPATIPQRRGRAVGTLLTPPESDDGKRESQSVGADTAPAGSVLGPWPAASFVDGVAEDGDEGLRPVTNAPDIAEQRALDLVTVSQQVPPVETRKQGRRRASVSVPTFEAGGQSFRILPRRRNKQS